MKMKYKFLRIFLILSIVLTSFNAYASYTGMPASDIIDYIYEFDVGNFVKDDASVLNGVDADSERIGFLNSLGLWDDTEKSKSAFLTLKEFNTIMSEISTSYQEISGGENVTYGVVIESLLKELGYYSRCSLYNDKEKAMLDEATEIGLIKNDAKISSSFVTRAEFAKLVERAITIDICVMKYENGNYQWIVKEGETILSTMHDIQNVSGFVNAIPGLSVFGDADVKEGSMEIDRLAVKAGDIDCTKYIGRLVEAYAKYDEEKDEYNLIYIGTHEKGKSIEIDFQNVEEIKDEYISYTDSEGNLKKVKIQNYKSITENGKLLSSVSQMSDFEENEGKIVISSSTKNGDYDVLMIYTYNYYVVKYNDVSQMRIGLEFGQKFKNQGYIQIDEEAINYVTVDNVLTDYTKIPVGSTIRVFRNDDTGCTKIEAVTVKQAGTISSVYNDFIVVADKNYRMSKDLITIIAETEGNADLAYEKRISNPKVNMQAILYVFGDVLVGYKSNDDYTYAYLRKVTIDDSDYEEEMLLRVYTQNMEWLDLKFADKITLDGKSKVSKENASEIILQNKSVVVSNLIRFKTNTEGKINFLDTMIESDEEKETTVDLAYVPDYVNGTAEYSHTYNNWALRNTRYMYGDDASIFVIPEDDSRENKYKVVGPTAFTQDQTYKITMYSPDEFLHLHVLVFRGDLNVSTDDRIKWLYVTGINEMINDEDELVYEIEGAYCYPGYSMETAYCKEQTFTVPVEDYDTAVKNGNEFNKGDLIRIEHIGNKLQSWTVENWIDKGKISLEPGHYSLGRIKGNNCYLSVGTIENVKFGSRKLVRLNCGEGDIRVWSTRVWCIINLKNGKANGADLSEFHEGDLVCAFGNDNSCSLLIKNIE